MQPNNLKQKLIKSHCSGNVKAPDSRSNQKYIGYAFRFKWRYRFGNPNIKLIKLYFWIINQAAFLSWTWEKEKLRSSSPWSLCSFSMALIYRNWKYLKVRHYKAMSYHALILWNPYWNNLMWITLNFYRLLPSTFL